MGDVGGAEYVAMGCAVLEVQQQPLEGYLANYTPAGAATLLPAFANVSDPGYMYPSSATAHVLIYNSIQVKEAEAPKAWTDLLAAISARDFSEIVLLGSHLLEPPSSLSKDDLTYLTTAMATAYIRMGEISQARSLLTSQLSKLDWGGQFSLPLRELFALTRTGEAPGHVQAGANKLSELQLKGP